MNKIEACPCCDNPINETMNVCKGCGMVLVDEPIETNFRVAVIDWSGDEPRRVWDAAFRRLSQQDLRGKMFGRLKGRYLQEQIADGYAYYVIIRENKTTVRIKHAVGFGDDYSVPYWGEETTIKKDYAANRIEQRDNMAAYFKRSRAQKEG